MYDFAPNPDMMKHFHHLRNYSKLLLFPLFFLFDEYWYINILCTKSSDQVWQIRYIAKNHHQWLNWRDYSEKRRWIDELKYSRVILLLNESETNSSNTLFHQNLHLCFSQNKRNSVNMKFKFVYIMVAKEAFLPLNFLSNGKHSLTSPRLDLNWCFVF